MMIWHIFKKDWKLLWPYAAGLAALHFALVLALLRIGRFGATPLDGGFGEMALGCDHTFFRLTTVFPILSALAMAFVITAIVQQDAIPGVRQDWLVRPIRRLDLFLAKVLGVVLMVLAPIFAADLTGALLNGFSIGQSINAAFCHGLWALFSLVPVVFALASVTRNVMEAVVGGTAVAGIFFYVANLWRLGNAPLDASFIIHRSVDWIDQVIRFGLLLIGVAVLLGLQYSLRKTFVSRLLIACAVPILLLVPAVPWQTAFALEQRLSPSPGAGNAIRISFVPDQVPAVRPAGPSLYDGRSDSVVLLPIRVTGAPGNAILHDDTSTVRITTADAKAETLPYRVGFQCRNESPSTGEKTISYAIRVPRQLFARIADQPLRVDIDYDLTLLQLVDSQSLPATGGEQRTRALGWCGTKLSAAGGEVIFGCIQARQPPACISVVLEYTPTGAQNRRAGICHPDYSPFRRGYGLDALSRFTEILPFGNPNGEDTYPVKENMLPDSQVKASVYEPKDHFTRQLTISQIRLRDWVAE